VRFEKKILSAMIHKIRQLTKVVKVLKKRDPRAGTEGIRTLGASGWC
jgi:hypothetical protein